MSEYLIPAGSGEAEFVEKRSTFLGHVRFVSSEEEARAFIAEMKKKYYDARHNCWCYIIKDGAERYSDDGEPQGTAGIPMLEVMRREGVCNVVCVVTRYFGGILLGTGGLLRAYTKSAKDALMNAGIASVRPWVEAEVCCSYSMAERLKAEAAAAGAVLSDVEYSSEVKLMLLIQENGTEKVAKALKDASSGTVSLHVTGLVEKAVRIG